MFPDCKNLSTPSNTPTVENWRKVCKDVLSQFLPPDLLENDEKLNQNNINIHRITPETLSRLKERIDTLELLNGQLYQYLCILVENLPELILETIRPHFKINYRPRFRGAPVHSNQTENACHVANGMLPFPTRREKDILGLLAEGYCAKEIAKRLFISETTVITHKKNLKKKFNVKNTVELISKIRNVK